MKKYYPQRPKGLPKGYDSWAEYRLHTGLLKDELYHPERISYTTEHKYEPDFLIPHSQGEYLIEFKGYFRDGPEAAKYPWIRKALEEHQELIFVFSDPMKPIHFRAKRYDGTRMTHAEWADKNKFRYFNEEGFIQFYNTIER